MPPDGAAADATAGCAQGPLTEPSLSCPIGRASRVYACVACGSQEKGQTKISLTTKVDPLLVSGITVEIGDKFLDYSVATQLKKLQALLKDGA